MKSPVLFAVALVLARTCAFSRPAAPKFNFDGSLHLVSAPTASWPWLQPERQRLYDIVLSEWLAKPRSHSIMHGTRQAYRLTPLMAIAASGLDFHLDRLMASDIRPATDAKDTLLGWTALMHAASRGRLKVVRRLLIYSANPAWTDENGRTAVDLALLRGHVDVAMAVHNWQTSERVALRLPATATAAAGTATRSMHADASRASSSAAWSTSGGAISAKAADDDAPSDRRAKVSAEAGARDGEAPALALALPLTIMAIVSAGALWCWLRRSPLGWLPRRRGAVRATAGAARANSRAKRPRRPPLSAAATAEDMQAATASSAGAAKAAYASAEMQDPRGRKPGAFAEPTRSGSADTKQDSKQGKTSSKGERGGGGGGGGGGS